MYDLVDDYLERRAPLREEHLTLLRDALARGELLLAGAFDDPFDHALFVWTADDRAPAEAFVAADPYVVAGLVSGWTLRHWNVVIGN